MRWLFIGGGGCLMLVVLVLVGFAGCLAALSSGSDEASKDSKCSPKASIGEPLRVGDVTWVVEDAKTATELVPADGWAWCWLGKASEAMGELDEARSTYTKAIEMDGEETDAPGLLANLDRRHLR